MASQEPGLRHSRVCLLLSSRAPRPQEQFLSLARVRQGSARWSQRGCIRRRPLRTVAAIPGPPSFCDLIDYGEIVIHLSRAEIQSGSTFAIHRLVSLNLRRSQFSTLRRWGSVEKLTFPRPKLQCDWAINRLSGMSGSPHNRWQLRGSRRRMCRWWHYQDSYGRRALSAACLQLTWMAVARTSALSTISA